MPYADPEKRKQYSKAWYEKNKHTERAAAVGRAREARRKWREFKEKQQCINCGIQHRAVIDFHHVIKVDKKSVGTLGKRMNYDAAVREAEEKCVPLCANCHRILHWNEHIERVREEYK